MSLPNKGLPVTISNPSTFFCEVPMIVKSSNAFKVTVSGTGSFAAAEAISPYEADLLLDS